MKTSLFVLLFLTSLVVGAQDKTKTNQPKEQSTVIREYDEQGNLIRFDSTYVSSWSSDSTMSSGDLEAFRKQMGQMTGRSFAGDSAGWWADPFRDGFGDNFFRQFGIDPGDSTRNEMPGFRNSFPDFEEMHRRMMDELQQFFGNDSIRFGNDSIPGEFSPFGSPDEFEKLRQEFEQQFWQPAEPGPKQKTGKQGSTKS